MKHLYEDLRGFLVFEGPSIFTSSDPTVQLPLTQLRADSRKLEQEISVLSNNPGIQSSLTQQTVADIQGSLSFLQRKVRLFQTAGVVNSTEGFEDGSEENVKTRATKGDLQNLHSKIYAAILILASSGTTDPTVQARIKKLQEMYGAISDMINKLDNGTWTSMDIPVYKEDINAILPKLGDPTKTVSDIFNQSSGGKLSLVEQQLATLVGEDNAKSVFNNFKDNGMFRVNVELGYNKMNYNNSVDLLTSDSSGSTSTSTSSSISDPADDNTSSSNYSSYGDSSMGTDGPYDSTMTGAEQNNSKLGGLDWKARADSICEQVRLRGLDPRDFGCISAGSLLSPAYSWRGHTKMICGRLGTTMDPNLPVVSGCPPASWPGWSKF